MTELAAERSATVEAIASVGKSPIFFEAFPASAKPPADRYREEVEEADIFVLLIGKTAPRAVMDEYELAYSRIPGKILAFIKTGIHDAAALAHIRLVKGRHTYSEFATLDELKQCVVDALRGLEADALRSYGRLADETGWEILLRQSFLMGAGGRVWSSPKMWLERKTRLTGLIEGLAPLKARLFNEAEYANYHDGKRSTGIVRATWRNRAAIEVTVPRSAFYYLVVEMEAPSALHSLVRLELRRKTYTTRPSD